VDANPYLVAATVLAGMRHGLQHRIDPGPAITGNGYEKKGDESTNMPIDWRSAIEAARNSEFLKAALGSEMHQTFVAVKAAEYARVARTVADVDYDLYLHTV
jgi:glutamine synthetase